MLIHYSQINDMYNVWTLNFQGVVPAMAPPPAGPASTFFGGSLILYMIGVKLIVLFVIKRRMFVICSMGCQA